jgi:hypothetical protein
MEQVFIMENSAMYVLLKQMLQNNLLVIRYAELEDMLTRFVKQGRISEIERKDLLLRAEYLKFYK